MQRFPEYPVQGENFFFGGQVDEGPGRDPYIYIYKFVGLALGNPTGFAIKGSRWHLSLKPPGSIGKKGGLFVQLNTVVELQLKYGNWGSPQQRHTYIYKYGFGHHFLESVCCFNVVSAHSEAEPSNGNIGTHRNMDGSSFLVVPLCCWF